MVLSMNLVREGSETRVAICDDNEKDRTLFRGKIGEYAAKHDITVEFTGYSSSKSLLFAFADAETTADVLFLDICMPEMDGIELAKELRRRGYKKEIVFLTVSDHHMLPAFDVGAVNYIVKDQTSEERFERVVFSALSLARKESEAYMLFSAGGENRNVPVNEIMYFELIDRLIFVHYGTETFRFYSTLGKLENRLRSYGFIRIHRSFLVSRDYVSSFSYKEAVLLNGTKLPVSRGRYKLLKEAVKV